MIIFKILFVCAVINSASSYAYDHGQLLNAPAFNFPQEYRHVEQRPVTYSKQFHFFTAPEETESYDEVIPETELRKNVRVVVIKAPENKKITTAIARLAKTLSEEKTAIYVLNKEPDLKELTTQIDRLKQERIEERPEVHFIRYKTPEEAELATTNIQSQYETLNGPSTVNKAETAPLHSYVGSLYGAAVDTKLVDSLTTVAKEPLYVSLPLLETKISPTLLASLLPGPRNELVVSTTTSPRGETKISPAALASLSGGGGLFNKLVGSTTASPLSASNVNGMYLPPDDIAVSSGKYLPPDNVETKLNPAALASLVGGSVPRNELVVSTTTSPRGETKISPAALASLSGGGGLFNKFVGSTTASPLSASNVNGMYLPPGDIAVSSGKYLPPGNIETKLSSAALASLSGGGGLFNKLVGSTTASPLSVSNVNGMYLPPDDIAVSSGKYLPPDNVETKLSPAALASLSGGGGLFNKLVGSTTASPLSVSNVNGMYLPPDDIAVSSGKYLPPDNVETKLSPAALASLSGGGGLFNKLVGSTTASPLSASNVNGMYLPPDDIAVSSGKYLPPDNVETKLSPAALASLAGGGLGR